MALWGLPESLAIAIVPRLLSRPGSLITGERDSTWDNSERLKMLGFP